MNNNVKLIDVRNFSYLIKCVFSVMILSTLSCLADDFPSKPFTMVVGFGVGGGTDQMARSIAPFLAKELGQPVQVINKKGAGTLLAANYVLSKPSDGYTIFASGFSPYLTNTILQGFADYGIDDFAYINFQMFDEDLIAVYKHSEFKSLTHLLETIRTKPKTVKGSVVRGSGGHLMAKLLLELHNIPQENLNLVTYNSGGQARAAVAGGVVDFIIISAKGSESIREYIRAIAIVSDNYNASWNALSLAEALKSTGIEVPVLQGTIRGYATTVEVKQNYPERFEYIVKAMERALANEDLIEILKNSTIEGTWTGPDASEAKMKTTFEAFKRYSYLLEL